MDEMYEIAQQARYRFLGVSEMYKICDGWNEWNRLISCRVWIWILENLRCLRCKSINFVLLLKPTLMPLFWLFGLCVCVWLLGMYESLMLSFIKLGCIRCCCGMKENTLNFALSPLCLLYMKFLIASVIKLGCKRFID